MLTLSTSTIRSVLADFGAETFNVEEPQIAGVSDEDIQDRAAVAMIRGVEDNEIEDRTVEPVAEGSDA